MHIYNFQHRIRVNLENNANIGLRQDGGRHRFTIDDITFQPWSKNPREAWRAGNWLATTDINATNLNNAIDIYLAKMVRIIPRISFVGQAYISYYAEPLFVKRSDKNFGIFWSIIRDDPYPLYFMDDNVRALKILLKDETIPDTFYYYWNDAVNTVGYTGKLLLMFGAIDSLAIPDRRKQKRIDILGEELAHKMYAQGSGLRNRLSHGEYLSDESGKNHVEIIHKKVLEYFNTAIIKDTCLVLDIVQPQRHFDGNYKQGVLFVEKSSDEQALNIHSLISDAEQHDGTPDSFKVVWDDDPETIDY